MARLPVLLLTAAALLVPAGPASAALRVDDRGPYWVSDETAAANVVTVTVTADRIAIRDTASGGIEDAGPCTRVDERTVSCARGRDVVVALGPGDDRLTVDSPGFTAPFPYYSAQHQGFSLQLQGDAGDDVLEGSQLSEALHDGPGRDTLRGGGASDGLYSMPEAGDADVLEGGADDDHLAGGAGPDVLDGGPGQDSVSFGVFDRPLRVTFDGVADDGTAGQGANVLNAESASGGWSDDLLVGGPGPDVLSGGMGADVLQGGAGDDSLTGGQGADALDGGDGGDRLDLSEGPPNCDASVPGCPAPQTTAGDTATCGPARDAIFGEEPADRIDPSCETTFGDPWGTPRCGELSCLQVAPRGTLDPRRARIGVPVTCTATGPLGCRAELRLEALPAKAARTAATRLLARRALVLRPGTTQVRLALARRTARRYARRRTLDVRAVLTVGGKRATRIVRLRRR